MAMNWTLVDSGRTNDESDGSGDVGEVAFTGWLHFVAQISRGMAALAPLEGDSGATYRPRTFYGYYDSDGVLKNKPGIEGGTPGVRLWANDPKFNLDQLPYLVYAPDGLRANGKIVEFTPFVFYAPSEDIEVKFSELQPVPSATAEGISRGFRGFRSRALPVDPSDPNTLWQWYDETGEPFGEPVTLSAIIDLQSTVNELAAELTANPESALGGAMDLRATSVLEVGAPGLLRKIDARGNSSAARVGPTGKPWLGDVFWTINPGEPNPVFLMPDDVVYRAKAVPMPWSPTDLPGLVAWFDAQQLSLTDGAAVESWPDLSGNGNTLVQATSGARPVFDIDKINGHAAVVANGTSQFLRATITNPYANPFTIIVIGGTDAPTNPSGSDYLISGSSASSPSLGAIFRTTALAYNIANSASAVAAGTWGTGPKLLKAELNGASQSKLDVNGVNIITGSTSAAPGAVTHLNLFSRGDGANFGPFFAGEVMIVQGLLSAADIINVLVYANDRWQLDIWSPKYLPNVVGWWDAQNLTTADGATVAVWPDLTGNGHDFTQATAGNQPVMDVDKINGHRAVVFDGTDDYMTLDLGTPITSESWTLFAVVATDLGDNTGPSSDFVIGGQKSTSEILYLDLYRTASEQYGMSRGSGVTSAAGAWTPGAKLVEVAYDGTSSSITVDGVTQATGPTATLAPDLKTLTLGARGDLAANAFWNGPIGELALVEGRVESDDVARARAYLTAKWGL